ncbi:MAG: DUF2304 domain-containing protein [Erysipelotrichaceae bacterium]|nr:DUF2304 domain-containing protein [Erysipelotrichaceae bacterium]
MMTFRIRVFIILFTILFFLFVIRTIRKAHISKDMATIWILWGLGLVVIGLFPQIMEIIANILGIENVSNTIFIIMIFVLYCLSFFLFIKVSVLENRLNTLVQRLGIDEKNRRDAEDKEK